MSERMPSKRTRRLRQLAHSNEGLLLIVTAWEALIVAFMATFSATGPLAGLDLPARLGIVLDEAGKVGRVIMLYHALAVPFVAALVYLILDALPFDEKTPRLIRPTVTAGYLLTSVGGLGFAYLGGGWMAHGLFLVGLSLVFYAGVVLCVGLFPWRRGAAGDLTFSMERLAFWLMALYTLISAAIGGTAGAYFGNGFAAFLAEDVLRSGHDLGQRAIIAHLHIMLTLIDVAILLIGWAVLASSTLAFVFVQFYMFHRPGQEAAWAVPFLDAGIGIFLVALFAFLVIPLPGRSHRSKF